MKNWLQKDLQDVFTHEEIDWSLFKSKKILITGSTGLIGSLLVWTLLQANYNNNLEIQLILAQRSIRKAQSIFGTDHAAVSFVEYTLDQPLQYFGPVDMIFHCAAPTSSQFFVSHPVETVSDLISSTFNICEFARKNTGCKLILLSSLEVYGGYGDTLKIIEEDDFGVVNPAKVRSSYSEGKRVCETIAVGYHHEYHVDVKIARLTQIIGSGTSLADKRVVMQFAQSAAFKQDIVLKTAGNTIRNYCDISDTVSALLVLAQRETEEITFNIANEQTVISIRELAELIVTTFGQQAIKVSIESDDNPAKYGFNPEVKVSLDTKRLNRLGWKCTVSLEQSFAKVISYLKETYE